MDPQLTDLLRDFPRQALHARRLELNHPRSGEPVQWEAPLPTDMQNLLAQLAADAEQHA
jgi:23S rRNA pseudouridine1911/1915/1917 synthase